MKNESSQMKIEILFFNDCPSWKILRHDLIEVLGKLEINTDISLVEVETHDEAMKYEFIGSPTIRINNIDVFPTKQNDYGLGCRVYQTPQGLKGLPTKEMLRTQVEKILLQ